MPVRVAADGRGFVVGSETWAPVGANWFDPLTGWAPKPWLQFDEERVEAQFRAMAALGVNTARVFLTAASFIPEPPRVEGDALEKLDRMVAIARRHGIRLHPTGPDHWEGNPPWRKTDIFADPRALDAQVAFWRVLARRYRGDASIFAFDLLNEPMIPWDSQHLRARWRHWLRQRHGTIERLRAAWSDTSVDFDSAPIPPDRGVPDTASPEGKRLREYQAFREAIAEVWVTRQVDAIRAGDPDRLVTVGLIQWSIPALRTKPSHYSAFRPASVAKLVDFSSVHFYPIWGDPLASDELLDRNLDYLELVLRTCASDKPLVLGEFGWYGGGSPRNQVARTPEDQVRWNRALVARSRGLVCGWLNWGWADAPSSTDISRFSGLVTGDGEVKPWGKTFAALAPALKRARLGKRGNGPAGEPAPPPRGTIAFPFDAALVDPAAGTRALDAWRQSAGSPGGPANR